MVRYKHRYFLVEIERAKSVTSRKVDVIPLSHSEYEVAQAIKNMVGYLHGDFGRATISNGFKVKYMNDATRIILIRVRHGGPDKLVSSALPFINNINKEGLIFHLLYTGATMRHSFIFLEKRQKRRLVEIVGALKGQCDNQQLNKAILEVRKFGKTH